MRKRSFLTAMDRLCIVVFSVTVLLTLGLEGPVAAQQRFEIDISTLPAGFASYIMGVAMAEQINKNSTWLHATAMEGRGPAEHMKTLVKKAEKRKNYLFFNTPWDIWEANHGWGAYKNFPFNYDEFKFVCILGIAGNGLCTLDPDIKSLRDLVGKRVIFDSAPGKSRQLTYTGILKEMGIPLDKIKYQYSTGKMSADTLRDGLVDVIYTGHVLKKLPNTWANSPFQAELVATKKVYFISFDLDAVKGYKAKTGHPLGVVMVPPKMLSPQQTEPNGILIKPLGFCAHISMPDRVVTEITRIVYENAHKFKEYNPIGAIITKDTLASLSIPEGAYHPAAVKFFKEKGIEITGFDVR
jgi:TRAP-type uncharacterized transport system substrate-binding protein